MLKRGIYGEGKLGKGSHFYHEMLIGKDTYKMQVSAFDSLTSVVGT
jgi:hypothetical protein